MATETNRAFYDAVTCVLSCALQADSEIQRLAEERKKALEMVDEYPLVLIEIIGSSEEALAEKHMASIFLKNYFQDIFYEVRENPLLKNPLSLCKLCLSLVDLLRLNFVSIKTMVCQTLSYIVYKGFWGLIDHRIFPMLKSENEEHVYNALFFLKHCMNFEEYKVDAPFKTSPEYFEVLLNIFKMDVHAEIRYMTIEPMYFVICYCLNSEVHENALSRLGIEFFNALSEPYSVTSDFKLKGEIISYISKFEKLGPNKHCHIMTNSLPAIGQLMTYCCDQFKEIIKQASPIPRDSSEDENEASTNFMDLIDLIIDLIKKMVFSMYLDLLLEDLDNLVYCLFIFMCCYDEMEEELFLEDSDKSQLYPIRNNAADVLLHIRFRVTQSRRKGPELFYKSIHNVFHKLMEETQMVNRPLYHARVTESLMFGLGYMSYDPQIDTGFSYGFYLDNWTAHMQQESSNPTVNGRLLWLGGIFSAMLSPSTLSIHLKAIIRNLQNEESRYLYVPSTDALKNHMVTYDKEAMPVENRFIVQSLAKELIECLLTTIQKMNNNPVSSLNALGIFVKHQEECAFAYVHSMQETLITAIYTHLSNVSVMKEVNFILRNIAMKESLQEALHHTMVSFLCKIVQGEVPEQLQGRRDVTEIALGLLNTIATYTSQPINEALAIQEFSAATNIILNNEQEDSTVNEAATNFITTLVVKLGSRIKYLRNSKDIALSDYIPKIIFECMGPIKHLSGLQSGKMCIVSIMMLPDIMEPHFESILKSILSGVQLDYTFDNVRGMWLVFIYIYMCRPANTTNFLSSIPGPDGGSALSFLINMWLPEYIGLVTKFERTVMSIALVQMITHSLENTGDKLKEIEVHLTTLGRNPSIMTGIEYLYLLLIFVVLIEHAVTEDASENSADLCLEKIVDNRNEEDNILLSSSPLNIDIVAFVTQFLKHENGYYLNVCRNYLYHEEIVTLSNMGCTVPQVFME